MDGSQKEGGNFFNLLQKEWVPRKEGVPPERKGEGSNPGGNYVSLEFFSIVFSFFSNNQNFSYHFRSFVIGFQQSPVNSNHQSPLNSANFFSLIYGILKSNITVKGPMKQYSAGNYIFKVNNRSTRTRCEICSKLTKKTLERCYWHCFVVFIVNFEHISHLVLVFLSLALRR